MLKEQCNIKMYDGSNGMIMPRADLLSSVKGADGVLIMPPDKIDSEFFDAAGNIVLSTSDIKGSSVKGKASNSLRLSLTYRFAHKMRYLI